MEIEALTKARKRFSLENISWNCAGHLLINPYSGRTHLAVFTCHQRCLCCDRNWEEFVPGTPPV